MESTGAINPTQYHGISWAHIRVRALLLTETCVFSLQCVIADLFKQQGRS